MLAYAFQLIGGRRLGPEAFAPVSVLWTQYFLALTILLVPLEQFAAREATAGHRALTRRSWTILLVVGAASLASAGFTAVTLDRLFDGRPTFVLQAALMVALMAPVLVGRGVLVGHRRFALAGGSLALEGAGKLAIGVLGLVLVGDAVGLAWGLALGPLAALAVPFLPLERGATRGRRGQDGRFLGPYIGAGMASQTLLAAAPLAVAALGGGPATISVVFVTFTSFRTPVSLVYPVQGRLLNALMRLDAAGRRDTVRRLAARTAALGAVGVVAGGVAGATVGPALVALLFGAAFRPSSTVAGLAAAGVVAAMTSQLLGQVFVAEGRTGALTWRWASGLAVAVAVAAAVPGPPDRRVAIAFLVGEVTTVLLMALGATRRAVATPIGRGDPTPGPDGPLV